MTKKNVHKKGKTIMLNIVCCLYIKDVVGTSEQPKTIMLNFLPGKSSLQLILPLLLSTSEIYQKFSFHSVKPGLH